LAWLTLITAWWPATHAAPLVARGRSDTCAAQVQATLSRDQQVGQLFMVGLQSGAGPAERALVDDVLQRLHAGAVVLYGEGWSGRVTVLAEADYLQALARAADAGTGLFVAGNQEGGQNGSFQAFYGDGFSDIPRASRQAALYDPDTLEQQAYTWGSELMSAGVNLDLAPVLDTVPAGTEAANAPIGYWGRQYGSTPDAVTAYGLAFLRGLHDAGVAAAAKHFPGLGRVAGNTDFTATGTSDSFFTGAGDPYLQPYRAAVQAGVEFMMVSSAAYPRVDAGRALFSPSIITGILRQSLGFQGVVISDDVGAAAAVANLSPAERALAFFRAGGDMVLTVELSDVEPMVAATLAAMDADPTLATQIEASVARVLTAKAGAGLLGC
jgi:beta-N-acetylhexosaminidase